LTALGSIVADGTAQLETGPHPDRARQDSETLLLQVLGKNKAWLLAHADEELPNDQAARFLALIERRHAGEPIQYITGEAEFYGLPFRVTPDVLIPRPETEHLVEKALSLASGIPALRILDIGTGSGAIAIALAHHLPDAQITALDISSAALAIARENAVRNGAAIRFLESNLLAAVADQQFDLIVSNPPYVPTADRDSLSIEVRDHEPALALFAGKDGLDIYWRLIPVAFDALASGGHLLLEIGYGQSDAIAALLEGAGFASIEFVPDLQGIPRVACARRPF
jgi:release factor glutamine methyltransferase